MPLAIMSRSSRKTSRRLAVLLGWNALTALSGIELNGAEVTAGVIKRYCVECHEEGIKKGGLVLEGWDLAQLAGHPEIAEKVLRKLDHRQMPPMGEARPLEPAFQAVVAEIATLLDRNAAQRPNPGRTDTFRRLNRTEYHHAIRDLLGVENLMWASDYPHTDTTWPESKKVIDDSFAGIPAADKRMMVCDNAAKLYGFSK